MIQCVREPLRMGPKVASGRMVRSAMSLVWLLFPRTDLVERP